MKIVLIHGEDIDKARSRYGSIISSVQKKSWNIKRINDSNLKLSETITNYSIFDEEILIAIDNMTKLTEQDLDWLAQESMNYSGNILLFYPGVVNKKISSILPKNIKQEKFDLPKTFFSLLDNLYPGNQKRALVLLKEVLRTEAPEFILALIAKHFRDLYWIKVGAEGMNYPAWRIGKLKRQCVMFSDNSLKKAIGYLAQSDLKAKTGELPLPISLDLFVATQLE